jgi:shikimate kinase
MVVFLDVSLSHAAPRVGFNQSRPLLLGNPRAQWAALMAARRPIYEAVATLHVLTDGRDPEQVAADISARLVANLDARSAPVKLHTSDQELVP